MLGQLRSRNAVPPAGVEPGADVPSKPAVAGHPTPDDGDVRRGSPELRAVAAHVIHLCDGAGLREPVKAELCAQIAAALAVRYRAHWHPAQALRGSGFRCLVFPAGGVDPVIAGAFAAAGVNPIVLRSAMPSPELTINIWCDPGTVASRIGSGSVNTVYTASPPATAAAKPPAKPSVSAAIAITAAPTGRSRRREVGSVSPHLSPKANTFRPRSPSPTQGRPHPAPPPATKVREFRVPRVGVMAMSPPPGLARESFFYDSSFPNPARTPPGLMMPAFTFNGMMPMRV